MAKTAFVVGGKFDEIKRRAETDDFNFCSDWPVMIISDMTISVATTNEAAKKVADNNNAE